MNSIGELKTIYWYMSKEVEVDPSSHVAGDTDIDADFHNNGDDNNFNGVLNGVIGEENGNGIGGDRDRREGEEEQGQEQGQGQKDITQVFSFFAKLMGTGDATAEVCRYPCITSIMSRNGHLGWQSLNETRMISPPVVEFLD